MKAFSQLCLRLDQTQRISDKIAQLADYFRSATPADAGWALFFLTGNTIKRSITTRRLREWTALESGYPLWLIEECYDVVGDLGETLALLLPGDGSGPTPALAALVDDVLLPLGKFNEEEKRSALVATWRVLSSYERLVFNKLLTGAFRVGVSKKLVIRALAEAAEIKEEELAHRLSGWWHPSPEAYQRLIAKDEQLRPGARPYPFFLAHPLDGDRLNELGSALSWYFEWKWDGVRAQLIRRGNETAIWSRGNELVTDSFPELQQAAAILPSDCVIDGEILAWCEGKPLPFGALQQRLNRRTVERKLIEQTPVLLMIYDLLERNGEDVRLLPLELRRTLLSRLYDEHASHSPSFRVSALLDVSSWEEAAGLRSRAREMNVEGLMIKRRDSAYGVGRPRGVWWKWKIEPYTVDAVLIYAQKGHGRRADLFTDYTFGVWNNGELIPVAKAFSGLSDEEIRKVDRFVRSHTRERFGPVRGVAPELVFELAFDGIQQSRRHKSGIALRFPRIKRWRTDKLPADADHLASLSALLPEDTVPD